MLNAALNAVYHEPQVVQEQKRVMLSALFDSGHFPPARIRVKAGNEMALINEATLAIELQSLTDEYYGFGNNAT